MRVATVILWGGLIVPLGAAAQPFTWKDLLGMCLWHVREPSTTDGWGDFDGMRFAIASGGLNHLLVEGDEAAATCLLGAPSTPDDPTWGEARSDILDWAERQADVVAITRNPFDQITMGWCDPPVASAAAGPWGEDPLSPGSNTPVPRHVTTVSADTSPVGIVMTSDAAALCARLQGS